MNYEDTVSWIDNILLHHLTSTGQRSLNQQEQHILDYTIEKYDCIFKALKSTINDKEFLGFWCSQLNKLSKQIIQDLKINDNIEIKGEDIASLRPSTSAHGFELARSGLPEHYKLIHELKNKTESLAKEKSELLGHNRALNKLVLELKASNEILDQQVKHIISKNVKESVEDGVKIFIAGKEFNKDLDLIIGLLFHYLRNRCYTQLTRTECDILNFIKANFQDSLYELRLLDKCVIEDLDANASIFKKIRRRYMESLAKEVISNNNFKKEAKCQ